MATHLLNDTTALNNNNTKYINTEVEFTANISIDEEYKPTVPPMKQIGGRKRISNRFGRGYNSLKK
jgi:hypothetical protein